MNRKENRAWWRPLAGALLGLLTQGAAVAIEGPVPKGIAPLDRVFMIVLENHSYSDIRHNSLAPFINSMADAGNEADHYYALNHPSLGNYLQIVGGSNFAVGSDNGPDWHSASCTPFTDNGKVCPLSGMGAETDGGPVVITGKSIAEQLDVKNIRWKAYLQSLPLSGADGVDYSDGVFSNLSDFTGMIPVQDPPLTNADMQAAVPSRYAVKHNPFAYFAHGQTAASLVRMVSFEGENGLYADLRAGRVPRFSLIVPDQCNDEHGVGNVEAFCAYGPTLIARSDQAVQRIVTAIRASRVWKNGQNNAIVLVWDEDDYGGDNQVLLVIETNHGKAPSVSHKVYNHYALLKSLQSGFRLPCLNHACDADVPVMDDLFVFKGSRSK